MIDYIWTQTIMIDGHTILHHQKYGAVHSQNSWSVEIDHNSWNISWID